MEIDPKLYPPDDESDIEAKYGLRDRCLHIWDVDGGECRVDPDDEKILRQAVKMYIEHEVDQIMDFITLPNGAEYSILASQVSSWTVTTSQSRLISRTVQRALKRAEKANSPFEDHDE